MANKAFTFKLEDGDHTVHIEHSSYAGKKLIRVDGKPLTQDRKVADTGDYAFQINGHTGVVSIRNNLLGFSYDVGIDGKSVTTGKPIVPQVALPMWAWVFIIACAAIPILSLGGIVPILLGLGGALGCNQLARDGTKDYNSRLLMCAGITVLCWVLFIGFIYLANSVLNR